MYEKQWRKGDAPEEDKKTPPKEFRELGKAGRPRGKKNDKSYSRWTLTQENEFRLLYHMKTNKELRDYFDKCDDAIHKKARQLKLVKIGYAKINELHEVPVANYTFALINRRSKIMFLDEGWECLKKHVSKLNAGKHDNAELQRDWARDKFGIIKLRWSVERYIEGLPADALYNDNLKDEGEQAIELDEDWM